jgi:hypothetical protein
MKIYFTNIIHHNITPGGGGMGGFHISAIQQLKS